MTDLGKLFDTSDKRHYGPAFNGKTLACCTHLHSHHSLDGASTTQSLIDRMKALEMTHVTITDHGNVNGCSEAWRLAEKAKMKIIHGVEGYMYWPGDKNPDQTYHITIWFKTEEAYQAYCKLTPKIFSAPQLKVQFGDAKACMNWDDFLTLVEKGIVVGTGCIGSWLNSPIYREGDVDEAKRRLAKMIATVGVDHIWGEVIVDDLSMKYDKKTTTLVVNECKPWFDSADLQKGVNRLVVELCQANKIRLLASQDAHYSCKKDKIIQDTKRYQSSWVMSYFQHMKGADEYGELAQANHGYGDAFVEELIANTHWFCEQFPNYKFSTVKERGYLIPNPYKADSKAEIFRRIAEVARIDLNNPVYKARVDYEIDVLSSSSKMDGLGYVLLTSDIVRLAVRNDILVNVRGSGGSSLLSYALGMSVTDPIKYNLQFERFLTRGRIASGSMPDFDLDFPNKDSMLALMKAEWGDARVIPFSIDTMAQPKSAIKDIERYINGSVSPSTETLTKFMKGVPQGVSAHAWLFGYEGDEGDHVNGEFDTNADLKKYAEKNPSLWQQILSAIGVLRQKSSHASGVAVLPMDACEVMPLYRIGSGTSGQLVTGYGPKDVEHCGVMKVDILGVKKMAVLQKCFNLIKARHGRTLTWDELPHEPAIYKAIAQGNTEGLFQLQTHGLTELSKKTKPTCITELSNLIALYRPGCLDWNMAEFGFEGNAVDYYLKTSSGELDVGYIHPDLEPILGKTKGVCLYQEQTLQIFRDIGGMDYEAAETVRRAIGKKDAKALKEAFETLSNACLARGWTTKQINLLESMIMAASRYSFNACLSGSTTVYGRRGRPLTVERMWQNKMRYHPNYDLGMAWSLGYSQIPFMNEIVDVRHAGERPVYRITVESGQYVECTLNHKIPVYRNHVPELVLAADLKLGDELYVAISSPTGLGIKPVVSIAYARTEAVYDVEMASPHNTLAVNNGLVVCNSHSTSYAIVAYNSAWLKHFYPLEFWCAELTIEDDEDKRRLYATQLGDTLVYPSLLKSHPVDWTIQDNKIVAPLNVIKGVGEKAAWEIYRIVHGQFKAIDKVKRAKKEESSYVMDDWS